MRGTTGGEPPDAWLHRREARAARREFRQAAFRAKKVEDVARLKARRLVRMLPDFAPDPEANNASMTAPDPRLLPDDQLLALVGALLEADRYDWRGSRARPEQIQPVDYRTWCIICGRGFGKGVVLDTPIPTPSGWTTMGQVAVGDQVFDETGRPCSVTFTTPTYLPPRAYRLTFSDGTTVDACNEHQWVTWTHRDRRQYRRHGHAGRFPADWPTWRGVSGEFGPEIRDTDEIYKTRAIGVRNDRNHCIPVTGALELPAADLPIDPYLLGYWLGNGRAAGSGLTCAAQDRGHVDRAVLAAGYRIGATCPTDPIGFGVIGGLFHDLRVHGLLGNKHVPANYLRGSREQRAALLAGLMDSGGYCDASNGHVEFCSTEQRLARAVTELARSFGQKPVCAEGVARLYGEDCGPKYRVTWRPTFNPFRLARKADLVRSGGAQGLRNHHRMIVSVEPIDPAPMRCIQVDSPNSMYLVGEAMIPTHNTESGSQAVREWSSIPNQRIAIVAKDHRALRDTNFDGPSGLLAVIPDSEVKRNGYKRGLGDVSLELTNGSVIFGFTSEMPDSVRGRAFDGCLADEYAAWSKNKAEDMIAQLWLCMRDTPNPRMIITTTPKRIPHVVDLMKRAEAGEKGLVLTRGRMRDNTALSAAAMEQLERMYAGTRVGRQELDGELLTDLEFALWSGDMIEHARFDGDTVPPMVKVVVGVDPSGSKDGDATGIVAVGHDRSRALWVLENRTCNGTPAERYAQACRSAFTLGAREIVVELSYGGDNCVFGLETQWKHLVETKEIPEAAKVPWIRGSKLKGDKGQRAAPLVSLYEAQINLPDHRRIWHVAPTPTNGLAALEDELLSWETTSTSSPNSMDALVHAGRALMRELGYEMMISAPTTRGGSAAVRRIGGGYNPW